MAARFGRRARPVGVMMTSGSAEGAQPASGSRYSELAEASLVWGHQWSAEVAQELSAGVLVVRSDQARLMPTASATVSWQRPGATLTGRLAQTADYSVMVGSAYQRRLATLAVGLPVNRLETMQVGRLCRRRARFARRRPRWKRWSDQRLQRAGRPGVAAWGYVCL